MTRRLWLVMLTSCVLLACSAESPTATVPSAGITLADIVINDPLTGDVAYSHGDHWHGALRLIYGDSRRHRVFFVARGQASHDAPDSSQRMTLIGRPDLNFRAEFEDPTLVRGVCGVCTARVWSTPIENAPVGPLMNESYLGEFLEIDT